jgi:cell filamentation protein
MSHYEYLDIDRYYTYENGVLKNKAGISDAKNLCVLETGFTAKRLEQLMKKPIKIKFAADLLKIHKHLFQDVYDWAGEKRKVEISKDGRQFLQTHAFDSAFAYLDKLLADFFAIPRKDKNSIAGKLAEILDNLNYGHFFREGNGRTQREFVRTLALGAGYGLNLNPPDSLDVYERYMAGTINGDRQILTDLILELLK